MEFKIFTFQNLTHGIVSSVLCYSITAVKMRRHAVATISEAIASYKSGSVTPREVVDQAFDDAVRLRSLNAFIKRTPEIGLHRAKESNFRYENKIELGPMDGIPIAIKDNFCTEDIPTTCGSKMLQDFVPTYNATVCERLFKGGAVLIGKTNMDQFGMGSGTIDSIFGPTKNIWSKDFTNDNWRIAGGSSGGSATTVASGVCFGALGSDTGGSTRNPASYCGIVGYKPTYGTVSRFGLIPLVNSMDVPGIMARTVEGCAHIYNVISGFDPKDSTTVDVDKKITWSDHEELNVKKIKVGIPKEYHCEGLSPDVLQAWVKIADLLEEGGAKVKQVSLPNTDASIFVYSILNQCEVSSNMARYDGIEYGHRAEAETSTEELYAKSRAEGFNNVVKTRILAGNFFLLRKNYFKYFEKALRVRHIIANEFRKVFTGDEDVDVLLTPTTLTDAPLYKDFIKNSNRDQCALQDFCTQPANMAGIPAISIPICLSSQGLPIGLQLMANNFEDQTLLTVAKWIESRVKFNNCIQELIYREIS